MDFNTAQQDMRRGYVSGAAGILASSLAWFAATFAAWRFSPEQAVWVLFVGGALIHPVGVVIAKVLGASGNFSKGNPLGSLAMATTVWLIFSLPLAFVVSLQRMELFFPAMLLIIGGRYLTFATLYGMRLYWGLGLVLGGAAFVLVQIGAAPAMSALAGAATELAFALIAFVLHTRWPAASKVASGEAAGA